MKENNWLEAISILLFIVVGFVILGEWMVVVLFAAAALIVVAMCVHAVVWGFQQTREDARQEKIERDKISKLIDDLTAKGKL